MIHEIRRLNNLKTENERLNNELNNQSSELHNLQVSVYLRQLEVDNNISSLRKDIEELKGDASLIHER